MDARPKGGYDICDKKIEMKGGVLERGLEVPCILIQVFTISFATIYSIYVIRTKLTERPSQRRPLLLG